MIQFQDDIPPSPATRPRDLFAQGKTFKARCIRPDHKDQRPSMMLYENGAYCFGCGTHWWPDQFLLELGDKSLVTTPVGYERKPTVRHIPMAMVDTYNKWLNTHNKDRLEWLFARGLRLEDSINPNKLGYNGHAFVIPVLDGEDVNGLRFRKDEIWDDELEEDSESKYWGLPGKNMVQFYKPVIPSWVPVRSEIIHLCEGELDALRLAQEGFRAWSLTNGCRAFKPEHVNEFAGLRVKVLYDQDAAGRKAAQRIVQMMQAENVIWPEVLGKDVTEYLQRWSLQSFINHL